MVSEEVKFEIIECKAGGLNPYCSGIWSRSRFTVMDKKGIKS